MTPVFGSRSFRGTQSCWKLENSYGGAELTVTLASPSALWGWITKLLALVSASVIPLIFNVLLSWNQLKHITRWFYSQVACNFPEWHPSSCWFNNVCILQPMCRHSSLSQSLPIHFIQSERLLGFCELIFGSPGGKWFCAHQVDALCSI